MAGRRRIIVDSDQGSGFGSSDDEIIRRRRTAGPDSFVSPTAKSRLVSRRSPGAKKAIVADVLRRIGKRRRGGRLHQEDDGSSPSSGATTATSDSSSSSDDNNNERMAPPSTARRRPRRAPNKFVSPQRRSGSDESVEDDDFVVDDNCVSSSGSENDQDDAGFSHRAMFFQDVIDCKAAPSFVSLPIDKSYDLFFTEAVNICCNRPRSLSGDVRHACSKIMEHINSRRLNWVQSGSWNIELRHQLNTSPSLSDCPLLHDDHCEVCNRQDRVASSRLHLSGTLYDSSRLSLDIVGKSNIILDEKKHSFSYHVGRYCQYRVELYHRMTHYLLHLLVMIKVKYGRLLRAYGGDTGQAYSAMIDLQAEFYDGFVELTEDLAEQYISGAWNVEAELSSNTEGLCPSVDEIVKWMPALVGNDVYCA